MFAIIHNDFVYRGSKFQVLVWKSAILTENFLGFPQFNLDQMSSVHHDCFRLCYCNSL